MERSSSSTTRQQQQHHRQSNSIYHTVPGGVNNQLSNRANHIYHNAHTPEHASSEELAAATRIANKDRAFNDSSRDRREHGDGSYSTVEANPQDDDDEARHHSRASGEFEALLGRTPGSGLVLNDSSSDYPPSRPSVADSSYKALDNSYVDESYASSSLDLSDGHDSSGGSSKPRRSEQLQPDDHHLDRVHDRLFASNDTVTQTSRSIFKKQKGKGKRSSRNRERTKEFAKEMVYVVSSMGSCGKGEQSSGLSRPCRSSPGGAMRSAPYCYHTDEDNVQIPTGPHSHEPLTTDCSVYPAVHGRIRSCRTGLG